MHEILVGRNDGDIAASLLGNTGIGRDQVVSLETFLLDAGQIERARCLTDEAELGNEIFRRRGAIGLVFRIDFIAERLRRIIEDDREMGRHHAHIGVARIFQELP